MKKMIFAGIFFILMSLMQGCGAGIIHRTTEKDMQAVTYDETKNKVIKMFFEGHPSIGAYYTRASIKINEEGFQVTSEDNTSQALCGFETVGDPVVTDYGPLANVQFAVSINGCNAEIWFDQKESAVMFAQLLYTLKHQAAEAKIAQKLPVNTATSVGNNKKIIKSDIDALPAKKSTPDKHAYAIVIGIERYRQELPKAAFAENDARIVAAYLSQVMGYPEENVVTLINDRALKSDMEKYFEKWLSNNVEKDSTIFVYFSGHGAPNPKTGDAYLVPYDGDPSFIEQTGYSLKRLYDALGKLQAKEIIVALDSCFSGAGGRSVLAKGARPLVMNIQNNMVLSKNMTVLSASSGEQISSTYDEKGHGLFTYFLLKGIKNEDVVNPDGSIRMDDLFGYIKPQVERIARKQYNNEQTPQLIGAKK
ncbi:MAG: caspase family protein [Desulfobacterales bacterium]|nr:caspase family protein [Desulfobacterales bacterium]